MISEEHLNAEEKLSILSENIAGRASTVRGCEVGVIAEGNMLSTDGKCSSYCIYSRGLLKTYQRETKVFDFSQNRKELQIKRRHFAMFSLCNSTTLFCDGNVTFKIIVF